MARLTALKPRLSALVTQRIPTLQPGGWRTSGMSSSDRGYGYRWQKARERHLQAHPLCVMCEAEGMVTAANVVDHKEPHRGDERLMWDESNWQGLCAHHHSSHKQREENAQRRK